MHNTNVSRKRAAAANTVFSGLQTVIAVVNGIVLVPVYLEYLTAAEYGAWLATGNVLAWLTVVDPGVGDLARQRVAMFYGARRWEDACSVIWTGGLIVGGIALLVAVLAQVTAGRLISVLALQDAALNDAAQRTLAIAGVGTGLLFYAAFVAGVIQSLQRSIAIGIVSLVGTMVLPIVRLVLLVKGNGMESLAWGMVAQGAFFAVAGTVLLARGIAVMGAGFRFGTAQFGSIFNLSAFTSLQRVASVAGTHLRGILVTRYLGPETTVVFEMTRAPLDFARTFLDKPMSSFTPAFAHLRGAGDLDAVRTYAYRFLAIFLAALGLCVTGYVTLNGSFVSLWLGQSFFLGFGLNALLAASFLVAVIVNAARGFLYSMGEIKHVSIVIILLAAATVAAQYLGLRCMGLTGLIVLPICVNAAFCLLGFPKTVLTGYIDDRQRGGLLTGVMLPVCLAGMAAGVIGAAVLRLLPPPTWPILMAVAAVESVVYIGLLLLTSRVFREEARRFQSTLLDGLRRLERLRRAWGS